MRHKINLVHFVGIGGSGMAGLAEVMQRMGYAVSGSDLSEQPSLNRLRACGVTVYIGHDAAHVQNADCVVYSGAVSANNMERVAAVARGVPVVPRAQMVGELMRFKQGIAVSGTHGKTTVSSMVAAVLHSAAQSPTCIIGGCVRALEGEDLLGDGDFIVVEADESDASFLHMQPIIAVVTNIDDDHLERFNDDEAVLYESFVNFLKNLPFYGVAVLCADNAPTRRIAKTLKTLRCVTYGLENSAEVCASNVRIDGEYMMFDLCAFGERRNGVRLRATGEHNVQNALAALAVGLELGLELSGLLRGLESFSGVGRRLETYGEISLNGCQVLLIDDYAHHPTEIAATLSALRSAYPARRLVLVFQAHRYSRTRRLLAALAGSVSAADEVVLTDVYAAGEPPPLEALGEELFAALPEQTKKSYCADLGDMPAHLRERVQSGDLLVTMGAGSIGRLPDVLVQAAGGGNE